MGEQELDDARREGGGERKHVSAALDRPQFHRSTGRATVETGDVRLVTGQRGSKVEPEKPGFGPTQFLWSSCLPGLFRLGS